MTDITIWLTYHDDSMIEQNEGMKKCGFFPAMTHDYHVQAAYQNRSVSSGKIRFLMHNRLLSRIR